VNCEPAPESPLAETIFSATFPAGFTDWALAEDEAADVELEVELLVVVIMDDVVDMELEVGLLMVVDKTVLLVMLEVEFQD